MEEIYAKIEDGVITQYPLTLADINNTNESNNTYYYCYPNAKPTFNALIERLVDTPILLGSVVIINYSVERKTLDELFAQIGLGDGQGITINQVPPEMLEAVVILTKEKAQRKLDEFAQTRGYDDMKSVCTYVDSQIPQYQQEASRAIYIRDLTWSNLYTYLNGILSGTTPLPSSCSDIEAVLPAMTWA